MSLSNKNLKRLCVLSDLNIGVNQRLEESAINLAMAMAEAKIGLVCRGGASGLIDLIAKTLKEHGGHVTCVASGSCNEQIFDEADEYFLTDSLHECKMLLFNISDGFVVLPGGVGTLEVLMEYLTWMQRIYQAKPVYIVDTEGFWKFLFRMFEHMHNESFLPHNFNTRYILLDNIIDVVPHFQSNSSWRDAFETH
jgi:uncharacterized protein (TIGR00730 family)